VTDTVAACPECDATSVALNAPGGYADVPEGKRYRCADCGALFDAFTERERQTANDSRRGLAGDLVDAAPDEVGP